MDFFNQNIILYLSAYLVAGIPFGYLLAKQFAGVDIKQEGSGNIGATNVLRVVKERDPSLAKKLGAITLFLDAFNLAVIGHCFSAFLMFEGGKGVATGFGVLAVMMPMAAVIAIAVWGIASKGLKISSLSSLIALTAFIIVSYVIYPDVPEIGSHSPIWVISIIIFYKHIPNIVRLFNKEEERVA